MTENRLPEPEYADLSQSELLTIIHETMIKDALYDLLDSTVAASSYEDWLQDRPALVVLYTALQAIPVVLAKRERP